MIVMKQQHAQIHLALLPANATPDSLEVDNHVQVGSFMSLLTVGHSINSILLF